MSLKIVLIDTNENTLTSLSSALSSVKNIETARVDLVRYTKPPEGLDAIFLVLPAAERWGAKPVVGLAQVLRTTPEDQRQGMPAFVVTGVVLSSEDARGPIPETKLLLATAIDAVRTFNATGNERIERLGFWAVNLLNGVTTSQLADLLSNLML
jgi:hypothetical protein